MKKEHIQAMLDGKKISRENGTIIAFYDEELLYPFRYSQGIKESAPLYELFAYDDWTIVKPPKTRPMTREEALVFVLENPKMLVSLEDSKWKLPNSWNWGGVIADYQYKLLQDDGTFTKPRRFEVAE